MVIFSVELAGWSSPTFDPKFHLSWMFWSFCGLIGFLGIVQTFISRLGLPSSVCPKCRSEITGRAHDTEQFLISAPKADPLSPSPQNPAKSKMPNEAKDCETSLSLPPQGQNESSCEIQPQPGLAGAENFQGVQARLQQPKGGTPKTLKRVTWSPSVQK